MTLRVSIAHGRAILRSSAERIRANLPNSVNSNHVAGAVYINLGARYKLPALQGDSVELFGGVQNLLTRAPPVAPSNQGSTNNLLFDPIGRTYRLGVRLEFYAADISRRRALRQQLRGCEPRKATPSYARHRNLRACRRNDEPGYSPLLAVNVQLRKAQVPGVQSQSDSAAAAPRIRPK
jgi:hypothetical protein